MKINILFFSIFIAIQGIAQSVRSPGYFGKKTTIKVQGGIFPFSTVFFEPDELKFKVITETTLTRKHTLGLSAGFINDYTLLNKGDVYTQNDNPSPSVIFGYNLSLYDKIFMFHTNGSISPIGRYFLLGLTYHQVNMSDNGAYFGPNRTDLGDITSMSVNLGVGSQMIFWNRVIIDLSVTNSYNLHYLKYYSYRKRSQFSLDDLNMDNIDIAAHRKIFWGEFFNLNFGVGVLF
jgi:hypothetical protein